MTQGTFFLILNAIFSGYCIRQAAETWITHGVTDTFSLRLALGAGWLLFGLFMWWAVP